MLSAGAPKPWEEGEWAEEREGREKMLPLPGLTLGWLSLSLRATESTLCIYTYCYYFGAVLESVRGVRIEKEILLEDKGLDGNFVICPEEGTALVLLPGDMGKIAAYSLPALGPWGLISAAEL